MELDAIAPKVYISFSLQPDAIAPIAHISLSLQGHTWNSML